MTRKEAKTFKVLSHEVPCYYGCGHIGKVRAKMYIARRLDNDKCPKCRQEDALRAILER